MGDSVIAKTYGGINYQAENSFSYFNAIGPTTQILLAGNRFMAVYLPQAHHTEYKYYPNRVFLSIIFIISITVSLPGFVDGCNFIFQLNQISWVPDSVLNSIELVMVLINESIREAIRIKVFRKSKQKKSSETPASSLATHSKNIVASNRLFSVRINH
ncbi:hypothetical protein L3Y34_018626 [Caenorhabditis briggsae]|uniref:7TM GPCR serpentine receptor class x (Srx) domain-containing protein n=1 Tax=Caenorhabditis briggsae TaxID=6238 RepID=A0AAE9DMM7_CAEBR|nr:hypothetical protein L3Y34_018626 [Caenorhabditis briggsae]